jgi:hypothetical protein
MRVFFQKIFHTIGRWVDGPKKLGGIWDTYFRLNHKLSQILSLCVPSQGQASGMDWALH